MLACVRLHSYFAVAIASVHLSAGRWEDALALYASLDPELAKLPGDHPNLALLASCRGYALHCMGATQQAFEQFVQSKVVREGTPGMGPKHVDTALASHNLGCCLDALGKVHRAIELVAEAEQVGQGVTHYTVGACSRREARVAEGGFSDEACPSLDSYLDMPRNGQPGHSDINTSKASMLEAVLN
jgi:hypothetical protein